MEKLTEQKVDKIFTEMHALMGEEVILVADPEQENKLIAHYDINAVVSKFIGLLVYSGLNVPTQVFTPPYNRVHADVEYWKNKFLAEEQKTAEG